MAISEKPKEEEKDLWLYILNLDKANNAENESQNKIYSNYQLT